MHEFSFITTPVWHCAVIALTTSVIYRVVSRSVSGFARKLEAAAPHELAVRRSVTLLALGTNALRYALLLLAAIMILREIGIDPTPLLAGASVAGIAIAMGVQHLVKDLVAGFFLIVEGQFGVGDVVELGGQVGVVEEIGLRVTRIRDGNGALRYWQNGAITNTVNYSQGGSVFALTVRLSGDHTDLHQRAVVAAVESLDAEVEFLLESVGLPQTVPLPDEGRLIRLLLKLRPLRISHVQQRLPARIIAALAELGVTTAPGREPLLTFVPRDDAS